MKMIEAEIWNDKINLYMYKLVILRESYHQWLTMCWKCFKGIWYWGNRNIFQTHECLLNRYVQFEIMLTGEITEVYLNSWMSTGSVEAPLKSSGIYTFLVTVSTVVAVDACKQEEV